VHYIFGLIPLWRDPGGIKIIIDEGRINIALLIGGRIIVARKRHGGNNAWWL
jgi:hypothetical protein